MSHRNKISTIAILLALAMLTISTSSANVLQTQWAQNNHQSAQH